MSRYQDRLRMPPSAVTGELGTFLREVWGVVNGMPRHSWFSGLSPNSTVTGVAGDLATNLGSASTTSRLWIKGGSPDIPSRTGWAVVRILE